MMKITDSVILQQYVDFLKETSWSVTLQFACNFFQCQQWIPNPTTVVQLLESYNSEKDCSLLTLDWVCPGRKEIQSGEVEGDAENEEQK